MEHIINTWHNNAQFINELAESRPDKRPTYLYVQDVLQNRLELHQLIEFRLVEVETGREVEFPLRLIADSRFSKPKERAQVE